MTFKYLYIIIYALANLTTCDNRDIPYNSKRRVVSFAHSQFATFGCNKAYEQKGTHLRRCLKSNSGKTYWNGFPTVCKGMETLTSMSRKVNAIIDFVI